VKVMVRVRVRLASVLRVRFLLNLLSIDCHGVSETRQLMLWIVLGSQYLCNVYACIADRLTVFY